MDDEAVLVVVINRQRDWLAVQQQHWYRIPVARAPRLWQAGHLAFFFSRAFGKYNGAVHYYARQHGHELVRRRDLLPGEANHPRADDLYYRCALGPLQAKTPPIVNTAGYRLSFINTTWARFATAHDISDLMARL
jgi:hypothetical protein